MRRASILFTMVVAALATVVSAQQMPNPADMAGRPLPAPELSNGTVSVRVVRERMGNNIVNQTVTLKLAAAATGDAPRTATTDDQGRATFSGIPPGTAVTVQTVVDGEPLASQQFGVPTTGGVRVALIAGIAAAAARERAAADEAAKQPARPGIVVFGGESRIIAEFQDDNLQVFYILDILNNARTPIDTGSPLVITLPEGAAGAGAMGGSSSRATVQNDQVRITGPFPPGTTQVQFGFRLPYRGDRMTLTQAWPAAFEELFVAAEKVGDLRIESPQFRQQQEANASGQPFLMATGGRLNAGEALTINFTGLPHRSTLMRDVGVGLGILILAVGLWAGLTGGSAGRVNIADLVQRREKLMAQLVELEKQRQTAKMDERKYAARRQSLVAQLERVMSDLDRTPGGGPFGRAPLGKPGGGGEDLAA